MFTYVHQVGEEIRYAKVAVDEQDREAHNFIHGKPELVNVLCLGSDGQLQFKHKSECCFNEKQKTKSFARSSATNALGGEYEKY